MGWVRTDSGFGIRLLVAMLAVQTAIAAAAQPPPLKASAGGADHH
jgi:hypothetical protein